MRNAVIVHGKPSREEYYDPALPTGSSHHWLPWLSKQLIVRDIAAYRPDMPHAYAPDYPVWCREFERFDIGPETLLVGHSCGAGFLVRWLSEHPDLRVDRVALVAPWIDPDQPFFNFRIDPGLVFRARQVTILHSTDDGDSICRSVELLRDKLPGVDYREFTGYGHFCVPRVPELLELLVD